MLKITNLQKTFNPGTVNAKTALDGLNLHIKEGDFVTVIGGNGAGKSTLQNAIAGVWKPDFGTIEIDGVDVSALPEHKRAQFLGRVFQDPMKGTAPDMEIAENLAIASKRGVRLDKLSISLVCTACCACNKYRALAALSPDECPFLFERTSLIIDLKVSSSIPN